MENVCNQKELCLKMRNAGLQDAIKSIAAEKGNLLPIKMRQNYKTLLAGSLNLLKSYDCLSCSILVARIEFVLQELEKREEVIREDEEMLISMLLKEMNVFVKG